MAIGLNEVSLATIGGASRAVYGRRDIVDQADVERSDGTGVRAAFRACSGQVSALSERALILHSLAAETMPHAHFQEWRHHAHLRSSIGSASTIATRPVL